MVKRNFVFAVGKGEDIEFFSTQETRDSVYGGEVLGEIVMVSDAFLRAILNFERDGHVGLPFPVEKIADQKTEVLELPEVPDMHPSGSYEVWVMEWTEYEAGWGQREDGVSFHKSLEDAKKYREEHSKGSPGYFWRASDPKQARAAESLYQRILDRGYAKLDKFKKTSATTSSSLYESRSLRDTVFDLL